MKIYDDWDGSIISLSLILLPSSSSDHPKNESSLNLSDPSSTQSIDLWKDIQDTIKETIFTEMSIEVEIIRTSWYHQKDRIDVCIIKKPYYELWSPDECSQLIHHLEIKAEFSVPLMLQSNAMAFKEMISVDFKLSTTNQRYFSVMNEFAELFNRKSKFAVVHVDDINESLGKS